MIKIKYLRLGVFILIILGLSGCSFLSGSGILLPDRQEPGVTPSVPHDDQTESIQVPVTDGFDFPVGDLDGQGWAVSGYRFLQWSDYSNSWHPGEDWNKNGSALADWGAPVYSIAHGLVIFSGWNTAQGNIILIEHYLPDGRQVWSQYSHLDARHVEKGEIVGRRQEIGTVGRGPSNRFSPHLHFEIRKKYQPSNGWPRTNGTAWVKAKVEEYYHDPTNFIQQNRPRTN